MATFAVLERGEGIARALEGRFGPQTPARLGAGLLVVSPWAAAEGLEERMDSQIVLLPGSAAGLLDHIRAHSAVSYGMSPKDTITLSSREGTRLWAALQRELVTVEGTVLERQELAVDGGGRDPMAALALLGAMLLLGAEPEALNGAEL